MSVDVPTLLASAGVSAVVSVLSAGTMARRSARAEQVLAARARVREAVRPVRQELVRWARQGVSDRKPGVAMATDAEVVAGVLAALPDLPAWRRYLIRRRLHRLFGWLWVSHLEVFPYDPANPMGVLLSAMLHEHRAGGPSREGVLLTEGLVHRTLSLEVFGGRRSRRLDRQLRRLAACW